MPRSAIKRTIAFLDDKSISQEGTDAFGGVMILSHSSINCFLVTNHTNLTRVKVLLAPYTVHIGGTHVPPSSLLSLRLMTTSDDTECFVIDEFNDEHKSREWKRHHPNGNYIYNCLQETESQLITSGELRAERSEAIIDFEVATDINRETVDILDDGTSDKCSIPNRMISMQSFTISHVEWKPPLIGQRTPYWKAKYWTRC